MSKNLTGLQEMRFAIIESLLRWEGQISNRRLRQLMGLSPVQASRLIAAYRRQAPQVLKEDTRQKRFLLSDPNQESPVIYSFGNLHEYGHYVLSRRSPGDEFEDLYIDLFAIVPSHFARLREACANDAWVKIAYAGRARAELERFRLRPQRMIRSISGWYVRAWLENTKSFETFNLARIHTANWDEVSTRATLPKDAHWLNKVPVRLEAHRALSGGDERAIRREFFRGAASRRLSVRECLVPLVLRDLKVAVDPDRQSPPEYTLQLANQQEVRTAVSDSSQIHV
jgi:predicted DNA-binding transcriptional regulator YafY